MIPLVPIILYYINSRNAKAGVDSANTYNIELKGLPTHIRYFKCDVLNFMINPPSLDDSGTGANGLLDSIALTAGNFIY